MEEPPHKKAATVLKKYGVTQVGDSERPVTTGEVSFGFCLVLVARDRGIFGTGRLFYTRATVET